ncbi:hypothetical protein CVT24_006532 [Panaeolus cyanescens]|uniref:RxLR effector protein n=1 Tax=Panaeolus cyanescens TaxID=181874 RepID=A0A409VZX6_9AGAR|nr:hypothetical protein CVT24_006532 [Panaeolus cyanescens]
MVQISKFFLVSLLAALPIFAAPLNHSAGVAASLSHVKTDNEMSATGNLNNVNLTSSQSHPDHASPAGHVLEARAPLFGFIKNIAKSIFGREPIDNDVEEIMVRANIDNDDLITRASGFQDLEARAPLFGFIKKIASSIFGRELNDNEVREVLARIDAQ